MVINDWIVMVRQSAAWLSVEFELYLVKGFQRLKAAEQAQLGWSAKRELAKINYRIHTDAIQQHLIPAVVTRAQMSIIYANGADVLNVALSGRRISNGNSRIQTSKATSETMPTSIS